MRFRHKILLSAAIVLTIGYLIPKTKTEAAEPIISIKKIKIPVVPDTQDSLSFQDSVKLYIKEIKIKYPQTVFKQVRMESGNFTSAIFKENNNLLGFKNAVKRPSFSIGKNRGYAVFAHWKKSIDEYALFQSGFIGRINNLQEYLNYLDRNYSELPGKEYSRKLSKY